MRSSPKSVSMNKAIIYVYQITRGLEFMHSKNLVHRDIKPENIVLADEKGSSVQIIDFGMTLRSGVHVSRVCGSVPYTPPEICSASDETGFYVDPSCDVWSLGVLLFCMLTGSFPWEQATLSDPNYYEFVQWQRGLSPKPWRERRKGGREGRGGREGGERGGRDGEEGGREGGREERGRGEGEEGGREGGERGGRDGEEGGREGGREERGRGEGGERGRREGEREGREGGGTGRREGGKEGERREGGEREGRGRGEGGRERGRQGERGWVFVRGLQTSLNPHPPDHHLTEVCIGEWTTNS